MTVAFENFAYSYVNNKKKWVFAPSARGREVGEQIKETIESLTTFDPIYYHMRRGGHVAALHMHRSHRFFAKIDLANFFYSVGRNRVVRSLKLLGIQRAVNWAKWSCVKNPDEGMSGYVLPYGFVQSPILATLVMRDSALGTRLPGLSPNVAASVYLDDIILSANDKGVLDAAFEQVLVAVAEAGFRVNLEKLVAPTDSMIVFNCLLEFANSEVTQSRRAVFYGEAHTSESEEAFERYCGAVQGR